MARTKPRRPPAAIPASPKPAPPDWRTLALAGAIAAAVIAAYANSFQAGFVLDNGPIILNDPRVHAATWSNVGLIFSHSYWWPTAEHGLYRPITTLSYLFNYAVLGDGAEPAGYHWINLALHVLNVMLAFTIARKLTGRRGVAAAIAAVWAVHPVLTEAVTNIVGRADLLAGTAILWGFLCYLESRHATGRRRAWALAGLGAATLIGSLSKESAVAIAGVVVLYEFLQWQERPNIRALVRGAFVMTAALVAMWLQRSAVLSQATAPEFHFVDNPLVGASFITARLTAIRVLADDLRLILWPLKLSCDYSFAQIPLATGSSRDWTGWMVVAVAAAAVLSQFKRRRAIVFWAGAALATLLPASNLLFSSGSPLAERFLYLPSLCVIAAIATALEPLTTRFRMRWIAPAAVAAVVIAFGIRTWERNADWRDDLSLWTSAAAAAPDSFETHRGLAVTLNSADPSHANLPRVLSEAERALAILDPLPDRLNTTDMYADAGLFYLEAGDQKSGDPAPYRRGLAILQRGVAIDQAVNREYIALEVARGRVAAELAPVGLPSLYQNLAGTLVRLGQFPEAIDAARHARHLAPLLRQPTDVLAWTLAAARRPDEAATAFVTYYLLSRDAGVFDALQPLYRNGLDTTGCAFTTDQNGRALNPSCPTVRTELCAGSKDVAEIYRWNRRDDLARQAEQRAADSWSCGPK